MPNITISVSDELFRKMKKYSEVKWSEVVRKALAEYIGRLEIMERGVVSSNELAKLLTEASLDLDAISLEKAVKLFERSRELEWKRASMTRAHS